MSYIKLAENPHLKKMFKISECSNNDYKVLRGDSKVKASRY